MIKRFFLRWCQLFMRDKIYFDYYIYNKCLDKKCEDTTYVMRRKDSQVKLTIIDVKYFLITENMRVDRNYENYVLYAN